MTENEVTVDELIRIASTDGPAVLTLADDTSNVKEFIREYGVRDGSVLVPNYKVYYDYCKKWKPTGKKLSKIGFLRKFNVVFNSKRKTKTRYYYLNEGVFSINKEDIDEAKRYDERYRKRIAKKTEQKKQRRISRDTEKIQSENETRLY